MNDFLASPDKHFLSDTTKNCTAANASLKLAYTRRDLARDLIIPYSNVQSENVKLFRDWGYAHYSGGSDWWLMASVHTFGFVLSKFWRQQSSHPVGQLNQLNGKITLDVLFPAHLNFIHWKWKKRNIYFRLLRNMGEKKLKVFTFQNKYLPKVACRKGGRVGHPLKGRSLVWLPAPPFHMSTCPSARYLTLNWWAG